jgi:hypothetical protein
MMVAPLLEEVGLELDDAVEIEGVAVQHLGDRHLAVPRAMDARVWVDGADARLDLGELGRAHEVDLVEDDHVGKGDLVLRLRRVLEAVGQPFGVSDRHHRVELRGVGDVLVDEEGLRDGGGVGEPRRLDDDGVELALALHQPVHDADEVAAHGAADAAVVHLEHFLVGAHDEVVVDADLAELVDDHGVALAVRLGEDAVQKRGLAGAEVAGEDGDGDLFGHGVSGRIANGE